MKVKPSTKTIQIFSGITVSFLIFLHTQMYFIPTEAFKRLYERYKNCTLELFTAADVTTALISWQRADQRTFTLESLRWGGKKRNVWLKFNCEHYVLQYFWRYSEHCKNGALYGVDQFKVTAKLRADTIKSNARVHDLPYCSNILQYLASNLAWKKLQ